MAALATAPPAGAHPPLDPTCASTALYVAAHPDDTLLFQSPALYQDIHSGRCVRTVFLTAGDAGRAESYWKGREEGAKAAYAHMAGAASHWTGSQSTVNGRSIHVETLAGQPWISLVFMRLPSGGIDGKGYERYGFDSLTKLWRSEHGGEPADGSILAVDGSASYDYQDLVDTVAATIDSFHPHLIATQNYTAPLIGPNHPDHVAAALFLREARETYDAPHRLLAYEDYEVTKNPENVFGELLGAKSFAFYAYGAHDSDACLDELDCHGTPYAKWLPRQYVATADTSGVVAHAGYSQLASTGTKVALDGSLSAAESGAPLEYEWEQVSGWPVNLAGAHTVSPSFVAPPHPHLLTFSLTVSDGAAVSAPDRVRVRIPSSDPTPTAVARPDRRVASGALVGLDGTGSWDPNDLPLEYAWLQTAGPGVELAGADTATPSFVAPGGPASLEFELIVSNGSETGAPASVRIEVAAPEPRPSPQPPPGRGGSTAPLAAPALPLPATSPARPSRRRKCLRARRPRPARDPSARASRRARPSPCTASRLRRPASCRRSCGRRGRRG